MTKIITEKNMFTRNGFQVVTTEKFVEDSPIKMTPQILIGKKLTKIHNLKKDRADLLKLIQHEQLLALTTDDDYKSRQLTEHVSTILVWDLKHIDQEIHALNVEIEQLRHRI